MAGKSNNTKRRTREEVNDDIFEEEVRGWSNMYIQYSDGYPI